MHSVHILLIMTILGLLAGKFSHSALAQATVFEDSFSNGMTNWQPVRDDGRYWKVVNQALEAYIPFKSIITELVPVDNVWDNSWKNIELTMKFFPIQGADKNISFGYKDAHNWYELHFTNTFTEIVKIKNGVATWIEHTGAVLPNGITYDLKLEFINGEITFYANGLLLFSVTDPTFFNDFGKIGLKASTGSIFPTKIIFDDIVVKNIVVSTDVSLDVPILKQTDPAWSELEYDTASYWLGDTTSISPNFKDWACNLISQVMLLHYHGITKLPDGSNITPVSLNQWLLNNNGYLDSPRTGNINRHSISRLSAMVSEQLGTPKLEYRYVSHDMITAAITEIDKGNPVILQLDGHFVLANGYTADKSDLLIKDPAYAVDKLSEHPLSLLSLRLYSPSQTDLSYISIHTDPSTQISLQGAGITEQSTQTYQEYLHSATSPQTAGPKVQVLDIAQPLDAELSITVKPTEMSHLEIYAIDQTGTFQELANINTMPAGTYEYQLHYKKDGSSSLVTVAPTPTPDTSPQPTGTPSPAPATQNRFSELRNVVSNMHAQKEIKRAQFKKLPLSLLHSVEKMKKDKNQIKLLRMMELLVIKAPKIFITPFGKVELLGEINEIIKNLK